MTIEEFKDMNNVKKEETVIKWINKGYIPGTNLADNYIPDSARAPYTKARAKNADSIYYSILRATFHRKHVLPQLYSMCLEEFEGYIERLEAAGYIIVRVTDGITYYDAPFGMKLPSKREIMKAIEVITRAAAEGITTAVLKYNENI